MSKKKRVCQTVSWKCDNQQCNGACRVPMNSVMLVVLESKLW